MLKTKFNSFSALDAKERQLQRGLKEVRRSKMKHSIRVSRHQSKPVTQEPEEVRICYFHVLAQSSSNSSIFRASIMTRSDWRLTLLASSSRNAPPFRQYAPSANRQTSPRPSAFRPPHSHKERPRTLQRAPPPPQKRSSSFAPTKTALHIDDLTKVQNSLICNQFLTYTFLA